MSFAARQRQLIERLRWAPMRGPRRAALLAELHREVSGVREPRLDLPNPDPVNPPPVSYERPRREPYWTM